MTENDARLLDRFETARPRLRAIATRLLGSAADADDAVQETWLRLQRADAATIDNLDAWLTTVVSRVCLDQLKSARRTRERSWEVLPWQDEPVSDLGDPAELAALGDRVSVALLVVLETLSPAERLAFVLHDVFGLPFEEVAAALDRSPDAARQLASRARRRLRDAPPARPSRREQRGVLDAWLRAVHEGDLSALLALLDEGAVLHADYGRGRLQTLVGASAIAEQATLAARLAQSSVPVLIDGRPGVAAVVDGRVVSVMAFDISDGRIVGLDVLFDPARLAGVRV
ncbi:sigma-70 family RNA polymerase sigma factor [Leifsonia shinshuensis]|uniref:Sigma-70 family RNA polymerase sigma factor n=1 Tax=Leifsonia shinshuensis TaxID=150026 RepID=A0A7G6YFJ0_9MICO|nr:sigma-70 family RNA polymerase sigma factor [Leifsonia shinshuensis]QNE37255.1 sigma-70 family RNA polymerase sigma factor [Leifsonia shinshuensis]